MATGTADRNAVLMYHSVAQTYPTGERLGVDGFRAHLERLARTHEFAPLPEVLADPDGRPKVAITFDGAYTELPDAVLSALREFDAPATAFVVPDLLGRDGEPASTLWIDWFDYCSPERLGELVDSELVTVGNKTLNHRSIVPALRDPGRLREEIAGGKAWLEDRYGVEVDRFCYPSGRYDPESAAVVAEGHEYAVRTHERFAGAATDPFAIPRFDADLLDPATLAGKLTTGYVRRRKARELVNRVLGEWYPAADAHRRYSFDRWRRDGDPGSPGRPRR